MEVTRNKVVGALQWKFFERISSQAVTFIVTLLLARILTPNDYGVVSIITIFINLATVFVQGGFNTALIQKKECDDQDYSSVMYFSLLLAGVLYLILYFCAPYIAIFYNKTELIKLIRVLSIVLFPYAINSIQVAYVTKQFKFSLLFKTNILANILSGGIGILLAIKDFGAWALVIQQILCQVLICLVMFITTDWRPRWTFSTERLKLLLSFGGKILTQNLLISFFLDLRSLLIGKAYSSDQLAYFEKGKQFPSTLMNAINGSIQTVMLPVFSSEQENLERVKLMVRQSVQISCYVVFPMMLGLIAIAKPMISVLLTDKWLNSAPFVQFFAISYMCQPIQTVPGQAIKGIGDANTVLKLEIVRKVIELILLLITININVTAVALSSVISGIISWLIAMPANKRCLGYRYREQVSDVLFPLILSAIMAMAIVCVGLFITNNILKILVQLGLGIIIYISLSIITKNKCFIYILELLKKFFSK